MTPGTHRFRLFTIPAGVPFVDALAKGVLDDAGPAPEALAAYTILLPTRRAVRSLREAFLRLSDGRPLLLPRLQTLGDLDEDALTITGWEELAGPAGMLAPPAISGTRRQLLLTRLVQRFEGGTVSPEQAARLAAELARLLDEVQTERLDFDRLTGLVPDEYAHHWQETLKFLQIVTQQWPAILAEEGAIDPAARRNQLLATQAEMWRSQPPAGPVIAAGSTGSIPATADLLEVIAGLPHGQVILPGLDRDLDEAAHEALDPGHPQYGMMRLLDRLEVAVSDVAVWPVTLEGVSHPARARLINDVLLPADVTDRWRDLGAPPEEALIGLSRVDCPGPEEEARVIALMMRGVLENRGRTAALVTPDRQLARRVASELKRWGITIDDSAGEPLARTPPGAFLRLVADAVAERFAPIPVLALLKHPLAAGGETSAIFRAKVRDLEIAALRGPRPAPGLRGLRRILGKDDEHLKPWLDRLAAMADEMAALFDGPPVSPAKLLAAHVALAEALAADRDDDGPRRLWSGEAGEAAAEFVSDLAAAFDVLGDIRPADYPALVEALMEGRVVRPRFGIHPRLAIWGLLEARLQHADLMILGGLNEGTWPPEAAADPWMSRPMRRDFGLPAPERRIGLTAHDFVQAFVAPEVVMTRSTRVDGTPTVPSRWLVRLDTFLTGFNDRLPRLDQDPWLYWQSLLDQAEPVRAERPAPRPPVAARPRRLSVTQVETWMRDPYAVYARHVLGLKALDPIDAAPDAAEYGTLIHRALNDFTSAFPDGLPDDALDQLLSLGQRRFEYALAHPGVWAFWWPRFERIAAWFIEEERVRRAEVSAIASEAKGKLTVDGPAGPFELIAVADRIDRLTAGGLRIIDYKTGAVPSKLEVAAGYAPQLPLEAAIASTGGFEGVEVQPVVALDYWRLRGGVPAGEIAPAGGDAAALAADALKGLTALVSVFDREETAYEARPRPAQAPRYSDYEHLARIKEWSVVEEGGE